MDRNWTVNLYCEDSNLGTFRTVKGMRDFLPEDLAKRKFVEEKVRECFRLYGYEEIETPTLESFDLISAKAGDEIRHRMFILNDLSGRKLALRPEITPSIARIVANKLRTEAKPLKLGYIANCFRYDNPQMGRYREFWQAGFELFGSNQPIADAEIISINSDLMKRSGFSDFFIKIGHVGVIRGILSDEGVDETDQNMIMGLIDQQKTTKALTIIKKLKVSKNCLNTIKSLFKLKGTNWKQIFLESKRNLQQNNKALTALENLEEIIILARMGGVETDFFLDLGFTRGLEYYTGMIFEVFIPNLDISLGGGGRYDKLVKLFGGESMHAVGCAPGIDRMVLGLEREKLFPKKFASFKKILVIPVNKKLVLKALEIASDLRRNGIVAHNEMIGRSIGSALSYANKKSYTSIIIIGPEELERDCVILRDLLRRTQREVSIMDLFDEITSE